MHTHTHIQSTLVAALKPQIRVLILKLPLKSIKYKKNKVSDLVAYLHVLLCSDKGMMVKCMNEELLLSHVLMWITQPVNHHAGVISFCSKADGDQDFPLIERLLLCVAHYSLILLWISISITSGRWKALLCNRRTMKIAREREEFEPSRIYFSYCQTYINLLLFYCRRRCSTNREERSELNGVIAFVRQEKSARCIKVSVSSAWRQLFGKERERRKKNV